MNPMISGLSGGKMSSSEADSKIDLLDSHDTIKKKIAKSFCEEGNINQNGVLSFCKHIIFPILALQKNYNFVVERKEEHGGNIFINSYEELEEIFVQKLLHPGDLKTATVRCLDHILSPIRIHFSSPKCKSLNNLAYPPPSLSISVFL
uniref:tyrosine--tRNA ligase n=1 Tax=Myxobolus squamalis TaxID=59785 RepID=A0A6B2FWZ4_MYXSQ